MRYSIVLKKNDEVSWRGYINELSLEANGKLDFVIQKLQEDELKVILKYIESGINLPPPYLHKNSRLKKIYELFYKKLLNCILGFLISIVLIILLAVALYPSVQTRVYSYIETSNFKIKVEKLSNYLGINVCKK